jgi:secondary thiamine-phosphate synthase enzyme
MGVVHEQLELRTSGKGTYEITDDVQKAIDRSKIDNGVVTVFVRHTSCSLTIMENAAPAARRDVERFSSSLFRKTLTMSMTTKARTICRRISVWC